MTPRFGNRLLPSLVDLVGKRTAAYNDPPEPAVPLGRSPMAPVRRMLKLGCGRAIGSRL
jgi:hypothetical protein